MRFVPFLVPLALACQGDLQQTDTDTDTACFEPGTLEIDNTNYLLPSEIVEPHDFTFSLENAAGELVVDQEPTEGGTAEIEVDWCEGPFVLTAVGDGLFSTVAGLEEDDSPLVVQGLRYDDPPETIRVSGRASQHTAGTTLEVEVLAYGGQGDRVSGSDDVLLYEVRVPKGEPFVLQAFEYDYDYEAGPPWQVDQSIDQFTLVEHAGSDVDLELDIGLSTSLEPEEATMLVEQPPIEGIELARAVAWVQPVRAALPATGLTTSAVSTGKPGQAELDVVWVEPFPDDDLMTYVKTTGHTGSEWLLSTCWVQGTPAELPAVQVLAHPVLPELLDPGEPLPISLPEGAILDLLFYQGNTLLGALWWPAGTTELVIPGSLLDALPEGATVQPWLLTGAHVDQDWSNLESCESQGPTVSIDPG